MGEALYNWTAQLESLDCRHCLLPTDSNMPLCASIRSLECRAYSYYFVHEKSFVWSSIVIWIIYCCYYGIVFALLRLFQLNLWKVTNEPAVCFNLYRNIYSVGYARHFIDVAYSQHIVHGEWERNQGGERERERKWKMVVLEKSIVLWYDNVHNYGINIFNILKYHFECRLSGKLPRDYWRERFAKK